MFSGPNGPFGGHAAGLSAALAGRKGALSRAWYAAGALADADLKFGRYYGLSLTTVRASIGFVDDLSGNWKQVPANTLRQSNKGAWISPATTNLFANPLMPATQTVALAVGAVYTVSLIGAAGSIVLSDAATGTVSAGASLTFTAGSTSLTATVSGVSGAFQFMQCETGAFQTSPAVGTRSADVVTATLSGITSALTLFAQANPATPSTNPTTQALAAVSDGTTANRLFIYRAFSGVPLASATASIAATNYASNVGSFPQGVSTKAAAALDASGLQSAVSGPTSTATTTPSFPAGLTQLHVGNRGDGTIQFNGYIERISIFPRRFSSAELQAITT